MKSAFGSVPKMLTGKMFPQNFRALQLQSNVNVFSVFPDLENMGLHTLIRQIGQVLTC